MKKIEVYFPATIDTAKLEKKLLPAGVQALSLVEMRVFNSGPAKTEKYRGVERTIWYTSKMKAEILVEDEQLDDITKILSSIKESESSDPTKAFISDIA